MKNLQIKVLICDDSVEYGTKIASFLNEKDFYAYTRPNDSNAIIDSIISDKPDIVISDLSLANNDSIVVINRIKALSSHFPAFILISEFDNNFLRRIAFKSGAAFFLKKPFSNEQLLDTIKLIPFQNDIRYCRDPEIMTTKMIQKLGIPAHIKGYRYLREAILECIEDRSNLDHFSSILYPSIAEKFDSTPARVERAIRTAIFKAWEKCDCETLSEFFGFKIDANSDRPTNSEFIALAADKLSLILK